MTFMGKIPIFMDTKKIPISHEIPEWQIKLH
ncbi:MAG: hypothetical protein H6Q32_305 [Bacteroidetes bacterium]|nr:hypothetical protein [Bacteroidota bacterium]